MTGTGGSFRRAAALLAAAALFALRCVPGTEDILESKPEGSVRVQSSTLGRLTIIPVRCTAGDRERFLGADFRTEASGAVVRLAVDPVQGPAVRVFDRAAPDAATIVFRRGECRAFQYTLEATSLRVNRIQDYRVALQLDCRNARGDTIEGRLGSSHCH